MPYEDNPRDDVPFDKEDYEKWEKERTRASEQTELRERACEPYLGTQRPSADFTR